MYPADKVVLGSTDACWKAVVPQLDPDVYYVKLDDDIVYIQVPVASYKRQTGSQSSRSHGPHLFQHHRLAGVCIALL